MSFRTVLILLASLNALICSEAQAGIIVFGSGSNAFTMEFVTIGDTSNVADVHPGQRPTGSVFYEYEIGKYEIRRGLIDKYNAIFGESNNLTITHSSNSTYPANGPNVAATGISWLEAARFVNWMNTSKGYSAAYKFAHDSGIGDLNELWTSGDDGYDPTNPYRNSKAVYALPSVDEWYKAAYFDPVSANWQQYATLTGDIPTTVVSDSAGNTAVYGHPAAPLGGPADVTLAGGANAYGIVGMNGNVEEWEETSVDFTNSDVWANRGLRGGYWSSSSWFLQSSTRLDRYPTLENNPGSGFRVIALPGINETYYDGVSAAVPEPSSLPIFCGIAIFSAMSRKRNSLRRD